MKKSHRIALWIRAQVKKAGAGGVIFGLSGGVDSAVVAGLCAQAAGKNCLGLIMPCESHTHDERDGRLAARAFKVPVRRVDLTGIYRGFCRVLPKGNALARANLKPRLRMSALYFFANTHNYLVVGTGNKSELGAGYFTKYGDSGVDLLPLGSLLKTEVRVLARELSVPASIIAKPPSAGLWPGQTDEQEMGITYDELDAVLTAREGGKAPFVSQRTHARVGRMYERAAHKRRLPPIYG